MNPEVYIGIFASIFTGLSLMPQLIKLIRKKKAEDLSLVMLIILLLGLALWVGYGFLKKDWIIIISNSFSFLINLAIILLSLKYKR